MSDYSHIPAPPPPPPPAPLMPPSFELAPSGAPEPAAPRRSRRGLLAGVGVLAVLAIVAGVFLASRGDDAEAQSLLARAAAATEATGSARVDMTMRMSGGTDDDVAVKMTMEVDFDRKAAHAVMDLGAMAGLSGTAGSDAKVEMITSGFVAYMKGSGLGDMFAGKWLKVDYGKMLESQGLDTDALAQQQGNDPAKMLDLLRKAGDVTVVGPETVRGASTVHHRATIDPQALYGSTGAVKDQAKVDELLAEFTGPIVADVWIGDDGVVRRYSMTMQTAAGTMSYEYEMYDFGVDVDVRIPSDDDVIDVTKMMGGK